jgi:hypothetical protein
LDVLRDDTEGVRVKEDTDDEKEVLRAAPMSDVPFTVGRGSDTAVDLVSPALSANVLRFGSGSPSASMYIRLGTGKMVEVCAHMLLAIYA